MAFELRQIEVGAAFAFQHGADIVEEGQAKIEDATRNGFAIVENRLFSEMPATRSYKEHGYLLIELVGFPFGTDIADGATDRIAHVYLSLDGSFPGWSVGVL